MDAYNEIKSLRKNGARTIGCFPLYPPLELFHCMGITPVVVWWLRDYINTLENANQHLQAYACSVARHLVEFINSVPDDTIDAIFMYNACDTLRNLPEILHCDLEETGRSPHIFKMHIPMVPEEQTSTSDYLSARILALIREMEMAFGVVFSQDKFRQSVSLYRKMRSLSKKLEWFVAQGELSYGQFSRIIQKGFLTTVEKHIASMEYIVEKNLASLKHAYTPSTTAVIISGILPPPPSLIDALENYAIRVVGNDIAAQRRSYAYTPKETDDPCLYYIDFYRHHFPCPTLLYTGDRRIAAVKDLISRTGARGFIFIGEKFCEYEYFEIPYLEKALKEMGVATLSLEISIDDDQNSAGYLTRIEAFAELLNS